MNVTSASEAIVVSALPLSHLGTCHYMHVNMAYVSACEWFSGSSFVFYIVAMPVPDG